MYLFCVNCEDSLLATHRFVFLSDQTFNPLTTPDLYLNQAFLLLLERTSGRPGKVPVGGNSNSQDSLYGGG